MVLVALVSLDLGMLCLSGPGPSWPARLKSILVFLGYIAGWNFDRARLRVRQFNLLLWVLVICGLAIEDYGRVNGLR